MLSPEPLGPRARLAAALAAAAACVAAGIATIEACLTVPPSDVNTSLNARPEIVHDAVQPPEGLLAAWPPDNIFLVPVRLQDPAAQCVWRSFDQSLEAPPPPTLITSASCATSLLDGGVIPQSVFIKAPTDGECHVYTFIVAHGFSALTVPDSIEGDTVSWEYEPPGALCNFYDAGAFQDGAFPPDGGSDGPLITPESSVGDTGGDP